MKISNQSAVERLQKLKQSFIEQLPAQLAAIKGVFLNIEPDALPETKQHQDLHRLIHTLKGASASFGLKDLSIEASFAENLAQTYPPQWHIQMKEHLDRLEGLIACIDEKMVQECVEVIKTTTNKTSADKKNYDSQPLDKVVYVCDDDPFQCRCLASQIGCFGFKVSTFEDLEKFRLAVQESPPDAIVMDMVHNKEQTSGAEAINKIMSDRKEAIPVVFVSDESDLESRLAAVRAGSNAYFVKPVNPYNLCNSLHSLITSEDREPCRILIVDDDIYLSEIYATILKDAGMETTILNDPLKAIPILSTFRPDLILMDMHMPGCNGMELAKAIKQMEGYFSIPIVFLSSETDVDIHFDARLMGGDEFLVKPIKSHHLISAVSVRAERMKLIRSFMVKDSMTGLYNHSAIKENLSIQIERAIRSQTNLSFSMIDIDKFKNINDTYGHPVGDQVLVSLASLLKQRLRKSDIIGRYGGEEFAVILPGCPIIEAVEILEELRKSFAAISFTVGKATFSSSFSSGVAALYDNAMSCSIAELISNKRIEYICSLADQALYSAKREGRNRVIAAAFK